MKRAYSYTKVNKREKRKNPNSIQEQKTAIKKYCDDNGIELAETFDDFLPPHKYGLDQLLTRCRQVDRPNFVIVTNTDRMTKDDFELGIIEDLLNKKGVKLIALNEL